MIRRNTTYKEISPDAATVEALQGLVLVDFGTDWCGHCMAARPSVDAWLQNHDTIDHLRIEDGRGRALGRGYRVKLWPTLILLRDGHEVARVVRPRDARDLSPLNEVVSR